MNTFAIISTRPARAGWLVGAVCLTAAGAGHGATRPGPDIRPFAPDAWQAVSDDQLAQSRGGFELGAGLTVSFGVARTVLVNGEVMSRMSFTLPDLRNITPEQARVAAAAMGQLNVVQQGAGNGVAPAVSPPPRAGLPALPGSAATLAQPAWGAGGGTVIQNTLDNQLLQQMTVLNTSVNSLGLLKMGNARAALQDAVLGALGQR